MLAESEPVPGSVIAIAAHVPVEPLQLLVVGDRGDRGVAEALARHREQQADVAPAHLRDRQHRGEVGAVLVALPSSSASRRGVRRPRRRPRWRRTRRCPSIIAASMSSSLGYSCSARSYLREIGRSMFIATWWAWSISGRSFFGVVEIDRSSDEHRAFHDADGPQVAVPPLDRVLLDEAVAAEQLDAVEADLHALVGAQPAGQRDLAGEVLALRRRGAAALQVSSRIAWSSIAMLATMNATDWRWAIGSPNASRSLT